MGLAITPLRCAIYARVSPKPEGAVGDNYSISAQLVEMKALALKNFGCAAPDEYIDRKVSGATLERPELDRLRDNVGLKLYDVVIVYSPDRWTRGGKMDSLILDQELKKGGAKLAFVSGSYDDTPEGALARDVQDAVSQYEREKFRERTRRSRRQKSREGFPHSCPAPYGYEYQGHEFGKRGEYVIIPEQAKVVLIIFQKTAQGMASRKVAAWLNDNGIRTQRKHLWFRASISNLLKKTSYYGELIQNGVKIKVPAIIKRDLWDRAHEALAVNKAGKVGRPTRQYLLSGLLWCGRCGKRMAAIPCYRWGSYRCRCAPAARELGKYEKACLAPSVSILRLEPAVWKAVWDAVCDPGLLWQLVEAYHDRVTGRPAHKDPLIQRIDRAKRKVARSEEILADPDQPLPYAQAKAQLEANRRELAEAQMAAGATVQMLVPRKDIKAISADFLAMRDELESFADRREALELLVEQIRYADGKAEIHCRVPLGKTAGNCNDRQGDACNLNSVIPFVLNIAIKPNKRAA